MDSGYWINLFWVKLFLFSTGIGVSGLSALILTGWVEALARKYNWFDTPNQRSNHQSPIPRIGGAAIVLAYFIGLLYFFLVQKFVPFAAGYIQFPRIEVILGAVIMALVGLWDDLKGLTPSTKLYFQSFAALIIIFAGFRFHIPFLSAEQFSLAKNLIEIGLTLFWIVGVINALNLLDGLDGLAAGVSTIIITSLSLAIAVNGEGPDVVFVAVFVGSIFGFLVYNSNPASIFMGDSGSLFLGFLLATFALPVTEGPNFWLSFMIPILALGLPILDTLTTILRRLSGRKALFSADKEHIHHRLSNHLGLSQKKTVHCMYGISCVFGISAVAVAANHNPSIALSLALLSYLVIFLLIKLGYIQPKRRKK